MIVEITTFELVPGTTEQAFLAADRRVQTEVIPNQPGFIRRTTARRDGRWLVVTLWWSEDLAVAYESASATHPAQAAFDALRQAATVTTDRYDSLD